MSSAGLLCIVCTPMKELVSIVTRHKKGQGGGAGFSACNRHDRGLCERRAAKVAKLANWKEGIDYDLAEVQVARPTTSVTNNAAPLTTGEVSLELPCVICDSIDDWVQEIMKKRKEKDHAVELLNFKFCPEHEKSAVDARVKEICDGLAEVDPESLHRFAFPAGASDPQAMLEGFRAFAKRPVQKKAPKAKGKGKSRVGEGYCPHAEKLLLPHELIREYLAKNGGKL